LLGSDLETNNETTIVVGNKFLIQKYARPLPRDAFEDRHIPMEMLGQQWKICIFYVVRAEGL
jgi:hypothetical protein